ncbi:Spo0E family sporulation regulatory protein-aspartic acid phosphatase [Sporomusaceae bacterium FL31]|nr:Spo0E family sporulation regulatory protein-aspartic acid phosphatase [Sporomusaceae bacterium FL31]GCE34583.1 Spo0E family sporulation regulatory protein-aspartic acid phosphatase [Sporomusaceae bacterium]
MSELRQLQMEIEKVRTRLHELVAVKRGHFIDPEVTELSEYLDSLIVKYEKNKNIISQAK